ncbi:acid protease [Xylariaceae sp. FL0594]|nr:acid protease [Xylariaceae sp. FL0594]
MAPSSASLPLSLLSYLAAFSRVTASTPAPFSATWSDQTYGPDGPWPAVEVTLGGAQTIALYPGREFQSFILTTDYCSQNSTCTATKAHLYNKERSQVDNTGSTGQIQYAPGPQFMGGLAVQGDNAKSWVDNMSLGSLSVPNTSLALISNAYAVYPNQQWYPLSVGCLGLGAPSTINQSFSTSNGEPLINASLVPGWLSYQNLIPSNSFAMHIGSADPPMPGSLVFGGYDQNRIIGDILSQTDSDHKAVPLQDISITVVDGESPWDFKSQNGLLGANNASIGSRGIQVSVDGCSPYLALPKSSCDAIAGHLPVDYNEDLGLYIWKEDDPKYSQIVSSASSLDFAFAGNTNTQKITISVPFRHLNLTLTAPLVSSDVQYFPCYTGNGGGYTLGRAFLQDAFIGAHWDAKKWWLAQAPGPNIPTSQIVSWTASNSDIKASQNDWKESWTGSWKALTPEDVNGAQSVTPPVSSPSPSPSPSPTAGASGGLTTGATAGIAVAAAVVGLAIIAAALIFFLRRRKAKHRAASSGSSNVVHEAPSGTDNVPQNGYYAPVKRNDNTAPNMTQTAATYGQQHGQQYPQQYPGGYDQQYSAELPGMNLATELPASGYYYDPHTGPASMRQPSPNLSHELPSLPHHTA